MYNSNIHVDIKCATQWKHHIQLNYYTDNILSTTITHETLETLEVQFNLTYFIIQQLLHTPINQRHFT